MHCTKCGNNLEESMGFCPSCGEPVIAGEAIEDSLTNSQKNDGGLRAILTVAVFVLTLIVVISVVRQLTQKTVGSVLENNTVSKQEIIDQTVTETKSLFSFPVQLNENTSWTDMTGSSDAIRYYYILRDTVVEHPDNTTLKNEILPSLCSSSDIRDILDRDIKMEYSYDVQNSSQAFFFTIDKTDCI